MVDEEKLLRRLKKRQRGSLEQAIEIYTPYLSVVLFNMTATKLPREDIEEIISDVFVSLWRNADRIDLSRGTIRSYISMAARNAALKRLQKQREYIRLDDLAELSDDNPQPGDDLGERLWAAVMELGEPDSEIFVRYYKYDEKLRDISAVMNINLSTVKTKLSRGKRKLKKIISDTEGLL